MRIRTETDFKALYRKLERTLERIERIENSTEMLETILEILVREFREDLGFEMGRLYRREGEDFVLCCAYGGAKRAPLGQRVPRGYPPHVRTLREGILIVRKSDPGYDEEFERTIGVSSTFAAIAVGPENTHVLGFSVAGDIHEDRILYSLSAVRHVINLKLSQQKLAGIIEEARRIQESLLPAAPPEFDGYDIHGRSLPAESVGGDVFDYLPLSPQLLAVAVGDASGHGLPAALLARDVITALRVVTNENLKVIRVVERLNHVIHRAALSSHFVSLFYGELESNGNLIYCNAGHNPPLLRRRGGLRELRTGGLVLGPKSPARYEAETVRLASGDALIIYTDGLVERENPRGVPFGLSRLRRLLRAGDKKSAREIVESVLEAAEAHARGMPPRDDVTVVVARRI